MPSCGTLGVPCRVFYTSTPYSGDLRESGQGSGIDGADAKCQARAQAAGLTGTYKAWLSGSTLASSPSERFTNTANTGPYVLPDANATVIAADWTELTSGTLQNLISVTETGAPAGNTAAWTHTLADGTPGGDEDVHCQEWTSTSAALSGDVGSRGFTDAEWTESGDVGCDSALGVNLYCFEQG